MKNSHGPVEIFLYNSTPMGVATYNNIRIKDMLPTQEQLRERMELLQKEIRETQRLMGKSDNENSDNKPSLTGGSR